MRLKAGLLALFLTLLTLTAAAASGPVHKGRALVPGDTIGIVAPATHSEDIDLTPYLATLRQLGYRVRMAPSALSRYGYFAGTDEDRAKDVNDFFADDSVAAILSLNGGYGSARILDKLDYELIAAHPKLFIGFSDITALEVALYEKSQLVTVSGPLLITLHGAAAYTGRQFARGLTATEPLGEIELPPGRRLETIAAGTAEGRLIGGNLAVIASLAGTPYELKGKGHILVLEEVGEDAYRVDRMLNQLWQNGLLKDVKGIVYGDFIDCRHDPGDFTTEEVLRYYAQKTGKPAIKGLPVGHGADKAFLPLGVMARLTANKDGTASLTIEEAHTAASDKTLEREPIKKRSR